MIGVANLEGQTCNLADTTERESPDSSMRFTHKPSPALRFPLFLRRVCPESYTFTSLFKSMPPNVVWLLGLLYFTSTK